MSVEDTQRNVIKHAQRDMAADPGMAAERKGPGFLRKLWDSVPRVGDGHLAGMLRLGGHELTQALAAFPDSNIRPMDEPGVFGNSTPQIVTEQMHGYENELDVYASRGSSQDRGIER